MDEPTAAMYSVSVQERERMEALGALEKGRSSYVLMIDMGAGTTDLALCRYKAGGAGRDSPYLAFHRSAAFFSAGMRWIGF